MAQKNYLAKQNHVFYCQNSIKLNSIRLNSKLHCSKQTELCSKPIKVLHHGQPSKICSNRKSGGQNRHDRQAQEVTVLLQEMPGTLWSLPVGEEFVRALHRRPGQCTRAARGTAKHRSRPGSSLSGWLSSPNRDPNPPTERSHLNHNNLELKVTKTSDFSNPKSNWKSELFFYAWIFLHD